MTSSTAISIYCPECGNHFYAKDIPVDMETIAPTVRSGLIPSGCIMKYRITSANMTVYITELVRQFCPDAMVEVVPRYCETKSKKGAVHGSYASLRIALSNHVIDSGSDTGWYGKIGETEDSRRVVKSVYNRVISRFKYDKQIVNKWMSYENMDQLERLGITESYLDELKQFCDVRGIKASDGTMWMIFAADPARVITDMLTDPETEKVPGSIKIIDIRQLNKDTDMLEYTVYLYPEAESHYENPHVRQILTGKKTG